MFLNLFLTAIFLASAAGLWYFISLKIPELVAVSDGVIVERLHEDSARVRIFLLHFRTFYREGRYRIWLWRFCEKICWRVHIFILRSDNALVAILQKIHAAASAGDEGRGASDKALSTNEDYWLQLRRDTEAREMEANEMEAKKPVSSAIPRRSPGRMSEVRMRSKGYSARQVAQE